MTLPEQLKEQAKEFRIYAAAECAPASKQQWLDWAETCEAGAEKLEPETLESTMARCTDKLLADLTKSQ